MLNILLTYDYELFFNRSFAPEEEVLINPSYNIASALSSEGVPATFFVDTPSVIAYKKLGFEEFPRLVKEQVLSLLKSNHDIQLHIHPIWYKSYFKDGEWFFDNNYYSLNAFSNVCDIIKDSKLCLDNLAEGNSNYHCCAFRAGGFCYSPVKEITDALLSIGIKIDSSVCKGWKMETLAQEFDYTKTPLSDNWFFDGNNMLKESCDNSGLFEVPIGTYGLIPQKWILTRCMPKLHYPPRKGLGTPIEDKNKPSIFARIKRPFITPALFSMDNLHANALAKIVSYYEHKCGDRNIYIAVIGHPKLSSNASIVNTVSFIRQVKQNCHNTRFVTMKDVAHIENL